MQTEQNKKAKKPTHKRRDSSVLDATANSLGNLAKMGTKREIRDRDIIKHNLETILELRNKGFSHSVIYAELKKSGNMTISESTYVQYVQEMKKDAKNEAIERNNNCPEMAKILARVEAAENQ